MNIKFYPANPEHKVTVEAFVSQGEHEDDGPYWVCSHCAKGSEDVYERTTYTFDPSDFMSFCGVCYAALVDTDS